MKQEQFGSEEKRNGAEKKTEGMGLLGPSV